MIIHEDDVTQLDHNVYSYRFSVNGNEATIRFSADKGQVPETGDQIVNNWLFKAGELTYDKD